MQQFSFPVLWLLMSVTTFANVKNGTLPVSYVISISVNHPYSDSLILRYSGGEKMVTLKDGKASLVVEIEKVSEMLLFTDINTKDLDDSTIIRFLAEPANMNISFSVENDIPYDIRISGSPAQKEKENWEKANDHLLSANISVRHEVVSLFKRKKELDSLVFQKRLDSLNNLFNKVYENIGQSVFRYVQQNPNSFLGAYLLNRYRTRVPADSLEKYYLKLSPRVKTAHFSTQVFDYLFTLSNDAFRSQNDKNNVYVEIRNAETLFDLSLPDEKRKPVALSKFRGKPTLLFFWATWCGPCHKQAPKLEKLINEFKNKPVSFVSISLDSDFDTFAKSDKKIKLPCTTLVDTKNTLRYFYQFLYVPHLILVDSSGKVIVNDTLSVDSPELKTIIENAMKN